ncbi:hypothetical protein ACQ4M4_10470 [Leptolyngbya sp. AN02str]|uniref:hypothetical protein n=1 Tax=Leptolyngbya sp. AN02str TaxID=3423363 RepID=UPI003D318D3F
MQYGPGFAATFLYYFSSTAIVFALVMAKSLNLSIASGLPQEVGIAGGLVGGLVGAYFNRSSSYTVPFQKEKEFLKTLDDTLSQMGYEQRAQEDSTRMYVRKGLSKLVSGKLYVTLDKESATIAGRAIQIKAIKRLV